MGGGAEVEKCDTTSRHIGGGGGVPESDVIVIASWLVSEYFGAGREKKTEVVNGFPSWQNFSRRHGRIFGKHFFAGQANPNTQPRHNHIVSGEGGVSPGQTNVTRMSVTFGGCVGGGNRK